MDHPDPNSTPLGRLSPPGSPLRAHESIWKRSKKILGMSRFTFLQQIEAQGTHVPFIMAPKITKAPKSTVSLSSDQALSYIALRTKLISWLDKNSPEGSDGAKTGKPPVSKRREQVRRAQKTHRQRTENYIKALEQEVLRLQKEEAASAYERQKLQYSDAYVKALEKQVVDLQRENGQAFRDNEPPVGAATLTLYDDNGNWAMKAELPQYPTYVSPTEVTSPGYGSDISSYGPDYSSTWNTLLLINPLANHQTAIDFVLNLERACMAHLHQHMTDPKIVSGHTLTATACLIEQAPHITTTPTSWMTSHAEIERLFQLASNLGLEGEITPIEAWNRIWQHPRAGLLTPQGLTVIESGLCNLVCCYGFGGAINELKFREVLEEGFAKS